MGILIRNSILPKELISLIHYIELNKADWWDTSIQQLILAILWLSNNSKIMVYTKYKIKGEFFNEIPQSIVNWNDIEPIYTEFSGWCCDIGDIKEYDCLPKEAKNYIEMIREMTGVSISLVFVGKERNQTIRVY